MASVNLSIPVDYSPDYDNIMRYTELVTKEVNDVSNACLKSELSAGERESLRGRIKQTRDSIEGNKKLINEAMVAMVTGRGAVSQTSLKFAAFASMSLLVDDFNRSRLNSAERHLDALKPKQEPKAK